MKFAITIREVKRKNGTKSYQATIPIFLIKNGMLEVGQNIEIELEDE